LAEFLAARAYQCASDRAVAEQPTDPRCKNKQPVSPEDAQALKELDEVVKTLKASQ
jgi:hypothetical protein